jgi:hypothetical protein
MGTVITIAIGVVFVFLTFSLVISGVNEALVAVTSLRAKVLWTTLRHFADNEQSGHGSRLTLRRFAGLLVSLRTADPRPKGPAPEPGAEDGGQAFLASVRQQTERFESGARRSRLKHVSPKVISRAVLELGGDLANIAQADKPKIDAFLHTIQTRVRGTQLEGPVKAAIAEARGDVERFRVAIEDWFDTRMKALSSLYRMWSRWLLLALSVALAFAIDVNPIVTVDLLRKDGALAEATVDQASAFAKTEQLTITGCPNGGATAPAASGSTTDSMIQCYESLRNVVARTRTLPPPLAFEHFGPGTERTWQYLVGCLIGAIAISFGAPFWFDVLRRLIASRT